MTDDNATQLSDATDTNWPWGALFRIELQNNATQLSDATGIPVEVAAAWLSCITPQDQPNPTNPLNIEHQPNTSMQIGSMGMFAMYDTVVDGFRNANMMFHNPIYENLRLAIANGDPLTVARAIELSPWDSLHYGSTYPTADGRVVAAYLALKNQSTEAPVIVEPVIELPESNTTVEPVIELPEFNTNDAGV